MTRLCRLGLSWRALTVATGLLLLLSGCQSGGRSDRLTVAAAANLQFAMQDLEAAFEAAHGIETDIIIGSSGKLTAQIQQGAPYDLLVSADMKYPKSLYEKGLATEAPAVYAYGALVAWTMQEHSLDSLPKLLQQTAIEKIALANPKVAPYGELASQWLQYHRLLPALESKLIYGESIAQTSQYISSGACDVGFTARSVVVSPVMAGKGTWTEPAPRLLLEQGVIITRRGAEEQPEASRLFYEFLFSQQARSIFSRYGYDTPADEDDIQ